MVIPGGVERAAMARECSVFLADRLNVGDDQLASLAYRHELDLVARFDRSQQTFVPDSEHHGHAWHVQMLDFAMLDRDLGESRSTFLISPSVRDASEAADAWLWSCSVVAWAKLLMGSKGTRSEGRGNEEMCKEVHAFPAYDVKTCADPSFWINNTW